MEIKSGSQTVTVVPGRRIIISAGSGKASLDDLKKLEDTVLEQAKRWKAAGWAYVADCSNAAPLSPAEAGEMVNMTKKMVEAGCKALGFAEGSSIMLKIQAQKNTQRSEASIAEGHFATVEEVLEWLQKEVNI